jgi:16S rRNA (uracil1498-N3)-methyltransferase
VERGNRAPLATFFAEDVSDPEATLGAGAAHHASVRRLAVGDPVRLSDGRGTLAMGTIAKLGEGRVLVALEKTERVPPPCPIDVLPPVADRERMLWLAEKCAELAVATWRPVLFARSRSVAPRGEGDGFAAKVRARMIAALEQSGGAWLPVIYREAPLPTAVAAVERAARYLLHQQGGPMGAAPPGGAALIVGPEGGIEASELALLREAGWKAVAIARSTLRFETAGVAGVAIVRAASIARDSGE